MTDLSAASEAASIHQLAVETDTELARLWLVEQTNRTYAWSERDRLNDRSYRMSERNRAEAEVRIERYTAKADEAEAEARPFEDVYRTYQWSRFFLCTASGGHIHTSMACSTCNYRTQFNWLPELSGLTEAEAVEAHGEILCSVCFPSAPVAWTSGVSKATQAERDARAAAKAERAAKKAAKALFADDPERFIKTAYDRIKTIAAAKAYLTDYYDWNSTYPRRDADGTMVGHHPSFPSSDAGQVANQLAKRTGVDIVEVWDAAKKRAEEEEPVMLQPCKHCSRPVVRCEGAGHTAASVCRGWRHVTDDPDLFHNIVCHNQETTAGFTVAEPTIEEI